MLAHDHSPGPLTVIKCLPIITELLITRIKFRHIFVIDQKFIGVVRLRNNLKSFIIGKDRQRLTL
jgi:hypothetical protein